MSEIKRYGIVRVRDRDDVSAVAQAVARYLPEGYEVEGTVEGLDDFGPGFTQGVVFGGRDFAGWTLDAYVIPRLSSGNYAAEEIDLSHPAMRQIPSWPVHKAEPWEGEPRCAVCGQAIRRVPGGSGPTWVHSDSGAVAAPNPPSPFGAQVA